MLHVTNNTMKKITFIIATLALFIFATAGCKDAYKATSSNNNSVAQGTDTPLSCDRENDQYYDFIETKKCLRPVTYEQLYILDKFRFFNQLASETPDEVIKIRIGFTEFLDAETYENLIVKEEKILELITVGLHFPDLDENGLGGPYTPRSNETVSREDMLQAALEYERAIFSDLYRDPNANTDPLYAQEDMQNFGIPIVEVTMKTSDIPVWWEGHKEKVRFIQPLITDIDPVQSPYYPNIPIVPRGFDPVIDWDNQ